MKVKHYLLMLLSWMMAAGAMAGESTSLFVFLKDGTKVQFVLSKQEPTVSYWRGVMTVDFVKSKSEVPNYEALYFDRDQVNYLKVDESDPNTIEEMKSEEPRIRFNLTRKGVVSVSGLNQDDHLQVYGLDGKNIDAIVSRHGGEATVDLSQQRRGVYVVSVNKYFTFKLMKP
jgi:hypothetical protein